MSRISKMSDFLGRCADTVGAALGEGNFAPGPAVWVGKREVAHVGGPDVLEVRLTKALIRDRKDALKADARIELRKNASDWLHVRVKTPADYDFAFALVRDAIAANLPTAPPGLPAGRHRTRTPASLPLIDVPDDAGLRTILTSLGAAESSSTENESHESAGNCVPV
jgi:hypothetical protein